MATFPFILADAGGLIGILFLVIWGILSLMSFSKKQKRPRMGEGGGDEPVFPEMEQPLPPPAPLPPPWPRRRGPAAPPQLPPSAPPLPRAGGPSPARERAQVIRHPEMTRKQAEMQRSRRPQQRPPQAPPAPRGPVLPAPAAAAGYEVGGAVSSTEIARSEIGSSTHNEANHRSARARRLTALLTPSSARQAILLSELLAPPLALREERP